MTGHPMGTRGRPGPAAARPRHAHAAYPNTGHTNTGHTNGHAHPRVARPPRARVFAAAVVALGTLLGGCSSGAEPIEKKATTPANTQAPATTPEEASRLLQNYLTKMSSPDEAAIKSVEASTARTVHTAQLRLGEVAPSLAAEFAIPRLTSYPRWFAAGAVGPGMTGDVAIFVQNRKGAPWRVHRLVHLTRPMPELSRDAEGYVTVAEPGDLPQRRAEALSRELGEPGEPGVTEAGVETEVDPVQGDATLPLIDGLRANVKLFTTSSWRVLHKVRPQGRTYALQTKAGGTVVWYVLNYTFSAVNGAARFEIALADEAARMLRRPVVRRQLSWNALYQSVAHAPVDGDDEVLGVTMPGWARMEGT